MIPRRGMTLAVVLLVMLVGTVLVGMSLYMAENLHSTTQMFVTRSVEYNETVRGTEIGKAWIYNHLKTNGSLPSIGTISGDIDSADKIQLTKIPAGSLTVYVYDLNYDASKVTVSGTALNGFPPRLVLSGASVTAGGNSAVYQGSYYGQQYGKGTSESSGVTTGYGLYLVRSVYDSGAGRQRILDEAVIIDPDLQNTLP
jgi:hypothetical protein